MANRNGFRAWKVVHTWHRPSDGVWSQSGSNCTISRHFFYSINCKEVTCTCNCNMDVSAIKIRPILINLMLFHHVSLPHSPSIEGVHLFSDAPKTIHGWIPHLFINGWWHLHVTWLKSLFFLIAKSPYFHGWCNTPHPPMGHPPCVFLWRFPIAGLGGRR